MTEAQLVNAVVEKLQEQGNSAAEAAKQAPSYWEALGGKAFLGVGDALVGVVLYILTLWLLSGNHKLGHMLLGPPDTVSDMEKSARVLGLSIVIGLILVW